MNWATALYAAGIWFLAAAWMVFRPLPATASHPTVLSRLARDLLPPLLLAVVLGSLT